MEAESTFPCAWVKHLSYLLRSRVNSQWYPSIYEDWRPKTVETLKNQRVRRVLQDNQVPRTRAGTREAVGQGPARAGSFAGLLGKSQVNGSLPCQTRCEQHQEGPKHLKSQGGQNCKHTGVVCTHRDCGWPQWLCYCGSGGRTLTPEGPGQCTPKPSTHRWLPIPPEQWRLRAHAHSPRDRVNLALPLRGI